MAVRRDWLHMPDGGVLMAGWFVFALMLAVVANLLAAMWVLGH